PWRQGHELAELDGIESKPCWRDRRGRRGRRGCGGRRRLDRGAAGETGDGERDADDSRLQADGRLGRRATARAQYGSLTKMNVVPCTIGALAPTNETFTSLTCRSPARPDACSAPSMMCQRPWMRPVLRLPPKVFSGRSPSSSMRPSWLNSSASPS